MITNKSSENQSSEFLGFVLAAFVIDFVFIAMVLLLGCIRRG